MAHLAPIAALVALLVPAAAGCRDARRSDLPMAPGGATTAAAPARRGDAAAPRETGAALLAALATDPPAYDPVVMAARLGRIPDAESARVLPGPPPARAVGELEGFHVHDIVNNRQLEVTARLEAVTDHAAIWVQTDQPFDRAGLERGARAFSDEIYPRLRSVFGSEWTPGVDGDPRVHVLHHEPVTGIAGYFSGADVVTPAVDPDSNAREMFYVNLSVYAPGSDDYLALLAHEFQHMIHHHLDYGEATWVNEGLSELAPHLVGRGAQTGRAYRLATDTPLTDWDETGGDNGAHYAASYLFFAWLHDRFGEPVLTALAAAPANGAGGVEAALAAVGAPATFDDAFLDWAVANRVGRRRADDSPYGYADPRAEAVPAPALPRDGARETVTQYGVDYWDVTAAVDAGRLRLDFAGDATVPLMAASPRAGNRAWWAGRGDGMDARLARTFDLSALPPGAGARLTWRTWYEIEDGWDQGYVLASRDGERWDVLPTDRASARRAADAVGPHVAGATNGWVDDGVDLSGYVGGSVTVSFELVTDDAVSLGGWALDDLALPATGWSDDVEGTGEGTDTAWTEAVDDVAGEGWRVAGWHRAPETLPQRWGVQAIVDDGRDLWVRRVAVDAAGRGAIDVGDIPPGATVTLSVSALTGVARRAAGYALTGGASAGGASAGGTSAAAPSSSGGPAAGSSSP